MGIFRRSKSNCVNNSCWSNCSNSYPPKNHSNSCNNYGNKDYFNFLQKKENTICSLHEVECFLCNCQKALKCFKFYCFFK